MTFNRNSDWENYINDNNDLIKENKNLKFELENKNKNFENIIENYKKNEINKFNKYKSNIKKK